MGCLLGIDLGTSSIKAMLLDPENGVLGTQAQAYRVEVLKEGYAQQHPQQWWDGACKVLAALRRQFPAAFADIQAVGLSGQMHGLVMLDANGAVLHPAIIWLDSRSKEECRMIQEKVAQNGWEGVLQNQVFPGFAFPSLLWIKEHKPADYQNIGYIMQPKDYLRYCLVGAVGAEVTDASATLLFDIKNRQWAFPVMEAFGVDSRIVPDCHESMEVAGVVTRQAAAQTGLKCGIPVVYGAGDQQCQSVGNGVVAPGQAVCNIGTGGQVSVCSSQNRFDAQLRTHTFCHCFGQAYTVFGAVLCAGMAFDWLKNNILQADSFADLSKKAGGIPPGSGGVLFLPYLAGERTPHMDADASGLFYGLKLAHGRDHMARAVMEGVVFALKDSLNLVESITNDGDGGGMANLVIASGGACASPVWMQMQADIFNREVRPCNSKEQACMGACILAGVGTGMFGSIGQACRQLVTYGETVYTPDRRVAASYEGQYQKFRALYTCVKGLYGPE